MPSAKSGTAGTLVSPSAPAKANEADVADPGEVEKAKAEQQQLGTGKYGSVPVKPFKPGQDSDGDGVEKKTSWIEIQMLDEDGGPVAGEAFQILLPDGSTYGGTLDEKGLARVDGIEPGNCQITFPNLDDSAFEKA
jgi:type VI secretion system secreted protein VgrG